jgi:ankyrin repeat protein
MFFVRRFRKKPNAEHPANGSSTELTNRIERLPGDSEETPEGMIVSFRKRDLYEHLIAAILQKNSLCVIEDIVRSDPLVLRKKGQSDGVLPLHVAAFFDAPLEVVQCLLEKCQEALLAKSKHGQLPLHLAAERASLGVVQCLADSCPDSLLVKDKKGVLPLHLAAEQGSLAVVECLANKCPDALLCKTNDGRLPLHIASRGASLEVVQCLANKCPDALLCKINGGRLPVDVARAFNEKHPDVAVWLAATTRTCQDRDRTSNKSLPSATSAPVLDRRVQDCGRVDRYALQHLITAIVGKQQLSLVQGIVRDNPRLLQVNDAQGRLPMHHATIENAPLELVQYLVKAYPGALLAKSSNGWLPLHYAVKHGSLEVIQCIAEKCQEALLIKEKDGYLALHLAVMHATLEVIQCLVDKNPEALRAKTKGGWLPLHVATEHASYEVVEFLADKRPESLLVGQNDGFLPLHVAAQHASLEVVQCLADKCPDALLAKDKKDGWLPLHYGVRWQSSLEVVECLAHKCPDALLVNTTKGSLPLHIAARHASLEVVQCLVDKCPDALLLKDVEGWLPLHVAATFSSLQVVQFFADTCPDALLVKDETGWLPLHVAAQDASLEVVQCLADKCRDTLFVKTELGKQPVDVARVFNHKHPDVAVWLQAAMRDRLPYAAALHQPSEKHPQDRDRMWYAIEHPTDEPTSTAALFPDLHARDSGHNRHAKEHPSHEHAATPAPEADSLEQGNDRLRKAVEHPSGGPNATLVSVPNPHAHDRVRIRQAMEHPNQDPAATSALDPDPLEQDRNRILQTVVDSSHEPALVSTELDSPDVCPTCKTVLTIPRHKICLVCLIRNELRNNLTMFVSWNRVTQGRTTEAGLSKQIDELGTNLSMQMGMSHNETVRQIAVSTTKTIRLVEDMSNKIDSTLPVLARLDRRLNNPIPRLFILVPADINSGWTHPKSWLRSKLQRKYYLFFVCAASLKVVSSPITLKVAKDWVCKVAPILATSLYLLKMSMKVGLNVNLDLDGVTSVLFEISPSHIAEMFSEATKLWKETINRGLLDRFESLQLTDEDVKELSGEAYELLLEKASEQNGWRDAMETVRIPPSPAVMWVSKEVAADPMYEIVRA